MRDPSPSPTSDRALALPSWSVWSASALVALLVRLMHLFDANVQRWFSSPTGEAALFDWWARGGARFLHEDTSYLHAPLQAWFLAAVYAVDGGDLAPRLAQVGLSVLSVGLVADLGRRLAGALAGLAGGLLLALCWPSVYFSVELVPATLASTAIALAAWALVRAQLEGRSGWAVLGALSIGVASMAEPIALWLVPAVVFLALRTWRGRGLSVTGARGALILAVLALLPALALGVRNVSVGDRFVLVADELALDAYRGNHETADGHSHALPRLRIEPLPVADGALVYVAGRMAEGVDAGGAGAWYQRAAWSRWKDAPGASLLRVGRKLALLVGAQERAGDEQYSWWREQTGFLRFPVFPGWMTLFALGVAGWIWLPRRDGLTPLLLLGGSLAIALLFLVVNERSRLPLTTVLAATAGVPVSLVYAAARQRRWRAVRPVLVAVVLLGGLSGIDRGVSASEATARAGRGTVEMAERYMAQRRWIQALPLFRDAAARAAEAGDAQLEWNARVGMVRALLRTPMFEQAEQHLEVLERVDARDLEYRALRGRAYLHRHDFRRAAPIFDRVLEENPMQFDAILGRAWVYMENGAYRAASLEFDRAGSLDRGNAEVIAGQGAAEFEGSGNEGRARRLFWRALELDWETAVAHQYLGSMARADRRLPEMLYHLRESLRLDPFNDGVRRFLVRTGAGLEHTPDAPPPEIPDYDRKSRR